MTSLSTAYGPLLARIHHEHFGAPARTAAAMLLDELRGAGHRSGTVVDFGCGSGILAALVSDAGYDVVGIDLSPSMLELAAVHAPKARFVCASLLDAEIPSAVAVSAVGECFNHAFDPRAGLNAFARRARDVHGALPPRGIFLFDFAAPSRAGPDLREKVFELGEWRLYVRAEEAAARAMLTRRIVLSRGDGATAVHEEEHRLHLYRPEDVFAALGAAGFDARSLGDYGGTPLLPGWLVVLARRRG